MNKVNLLGVFIDKLPWKRFLNVIESAIHQDNHVLIMHANIRAVNLAYENQDYRRVLNSADFVFCDGMGLLLGARLLGNQLTERFTGADWLYQLAEYSAKRDFSLFFLGSLPGVSDEAAAQLKRSYPKLKIAGTYHGYFDKTKDHPENQELIQLINASKTNILLVGFGMPLQEYWLYENWSSLNVNVAIAVGAVFEYIAGELKRGPDWMTQNYLEWLARVLISPGRYAVRYLHDIPLFAVRILRQKFFGLPYSDDA
jgi:N-acetylglucosaminyldiphosphoundecaprenol N-acetyl-beta-D-mannosaminyltransferase